MSRENFVICFAIIESFFFFVVVLISLQVVLNENLAQPLLLLSIKEKK